MLSALAGLAGNVAGGTEFQCPPGVFGVLDHGGAVAHEFRVVRGGGADGDGLAVRAVGPAMPEALTVRKIFFVRLGGERETNARLGAVLHRLARAVAGVLAVLQGLGTRAPATARPTVAAEVGAKAAANSSEARQLGLVVTKTGRATLRDTRGRRGLITFATGI